MALGGKRALGLTAVQIAAMFTVCSLVEIAVQSIVFSPLGHPEATRWLTAPAFAVLAVGIVLVPLAGSLALMLAMIGAVAARAGIVSPILTFWIASHAEHASGPSLAARPPPPASARLIPGAGAPRPATGTP